MKERGVFVFKNAEGVILVGFERREKGVPIESLLPPSGRGEGFADFKLASYFDLAGLVLASPEDWANFGNSAGAKGATEAKPAKVTAPPIDLDFLKLRGENGEILPEKTAELFTIVAAYWQSNNTLALEPGLVPEAWRRGLNPDQILLFIRKHTTADGKFNPPKLKDAVQTAQKTLRKKRKLGKLNRKRGRQ